MQGKKSYQPKLFNSFNLSARIPEHNFYRKLKGVLDLHFLYKETRSYYGDCGQKSLDPTVFFKLSLVGYLENLISDRQLIQHASMRLDILYFIDYDIDEELPPILGAGCGIRPSAGHVTYFLMRYLISYLKRCC